MEYREEHDSLGIIKVPKTALWGAQTERSRHNFAVGPVMPELVVRALINIKKAAARVNKQLGQLDERRALLIEQACDQILAMPEMMSSFPLKVYQTGSGTQSNMNVNEVISHVAHELDPHLLIHPNDHVNMAQSSNDTFPTAMQIAAFQETKRVLTVLEKVDQTLKGKQEEFWQVVKIGRTHLQDAVPMTFGQEISGWRAALNHSRQALQANLMLLAELPIGGTAIGTGLNVPEGFDQAMVTELGKIYRLKLVCAPNKFQGLANHTGINIIHGIFKSLASDLVKIGNDIRFLASGPRAGYEELVIPANEPGSSIMPGKVNPTQIEALTMAAATVMGNDTTITFAASQGNFEMNVYKPVIIQAFLASADLLAGVTASFEEHCLRGLTVNQQRMHELVDNSLMLVTALSPHIGYEKSAEIALTAQRQQLTLRQAALQSGYLTADEYDQWIEPLAMTNSQCID
ncbi:class II fumarate hydratase [Ligilactobacillus saerimneri]|uniref:class II fumarate hydratase n=1 Tax=Ligilactobacillus saerimneri TaxID=228229 RepID=UPI001C11FAAB|nr:class II fumarate hydratase [Ligilactobacillus saerimneri]MBU5310164.1 class II fumarate hydratase [Ligilactobacillus saerimneri]MCZ0891091.1 class II fumarate hydratase [Ligilactobacillus saerimneri]